MSFSGSEDSLSIPGFQVFPGLQPPCAPHPQHHSVNTSPQRYEMTTHVFVPFHTILFIALQGNGPETQFIHASLELSHTHRH